MLRGPSNRPAVLVPAVVALGLLIGLALRGRWVELGVVLVLAALLDVWQRVRPQRRAGRVRRSWLWHED